MDKRREWAAVATAQIVNLHWSIDAPKHVIYSEIEKVVLAAVCRAVAEMRNDMLKGIGELSDDWERGGVCDAAGTP
jgi:hypothetical protein